MVLKLVLGGTETPKGRRMQSRRPSAAGRRKGPEAVTEQKTGYITARKLFYAIGSRDKTFRVFTAEEGGAQHCQRDYLTLACDVIADWLEEKLK